MNTNTIEQINTNLIRLNFEVYINTKPNVLWDILWNPNKMNDWLRIFEETTYVEGKMESGENIRFLNSNNSGMNSIVHSKITNKQMIFKHIGMIENGIPSNKDEYQIWENAMEGYIITEVENTCKLEVFVETTEDYIDYFKEKFNKVLEFIKIKCEN